MSSLQKLRENRIWILILGLILLVAVRLVAMMSGEEEVTGYASSLMWTLIQAGAALLVFALTGIPVLADKRPCTFRVSMASRIFSLIAAAAFAAKFVENIVLVVQSFSLSANVYALIIPWGSIAEALLSLISVAFFLLLFLEGDNLSHETMLIIIAPVVLYVIRLVRLFLKLTMNPAVVIYAILLLAAGFTLLFLVALGRVLILHECWRAFYIKAILAAGATGMAACGLLIALLAQLPAFMPEISIPDLAADLALMLLAVGMSAYTKPLPQEDKLPPAPEEIVKMDTIQYDLDSLTEPVRSLSASAAENKNPSLRPNHRSRH